MKSTPCFIENTITVHVQLHLKSAWAEISFWSHWLFQPVFIWNENFSPVSQSGLEFFTLSRICWISAHTKTFSMKSPSSFQEVDCLQKIDWNLWQFYVGSKQKNNLEKWRDIFQHLLILLFQSRRKLGEILEPNLLTAFT